MTTYMAFMRHSAESCPLFNDETKNKLKELSSKREEVAKKHKINVLNAVFSPLEHLAVYLVEAPSHRELELYLREIGFAFYNNIQIREVAFMEDAFKTL